MSIDRTFQQIHHINSHWDKNHKNIPKTASQAALLNAALCSHCGKFAGQNPDGSIRRHSKCPVQSQPPAPEARVEFARAAAAGQRVRAADEVDTLLDDETTHPRRTRRVTRAQWSHRMSELFKDYADQSLLGDYNQMAQILGCILANSPSENLPVRMRHSVQFDDGWRIRKAVHILRTSGRTGKALSALSASEPFEISGANEHCTYFQVANNTWKSLKTCGRMNDTVSS